MAANDRQVGGEHYRKLGAVQHWDLSALYQWDPMQYQIIKYTMRWRDKNGLLDLEKVPHFCEKYIEDVKAGRMPGPGDFPLKPLGREHWLAVLGAVDADIFDQVLKQRDAAELAIAVRGMNERHTLEVRLHADDVMPLVHEAVAPVQAAQSVNWIEKYNVRHGFSDDGTRRLSIGEWIAKTGQLPDEYMIVPKDSVKPTAWKEFTFEGSKSGEDWYRCMRCREHFKVPLSDPPLSHHCPIAVEGA